MRGAREMKFEDFWKEAWRKMTLPSGAEKLLPKSLSNETKKRLMHMKPEEAAKIIELAVDKVNHGAIDSIDKLVRTAIDR